MAVILETAEREVRELLTTHYYKTSYEKLKEGFLEILKSLKFRIVSIDDNYNEVFAEIPHMTVLVKFSEQNPRETAIDFYINAEFLLFSARKANDYLYTFYQELGKKFELKGTGLHK